MTLFVLGNAAVDTFYEVPHLPRPGETLIAGQAVDDLGGKGLNQAVMAARAGASVSFWSAVGVDEAGRRIRAQLREENIDTRTLRAEPGDTDRSLIFVAPSGENSIVSTAAMARSIGPDCVTRMLEDMTGRDLLLAQGNLTRDATHDSLKEAAGRGIRTLLNPAPIDFDYADILPLADVIIVNEVENRTLSGRNEPATGSAALIERGAKLVITTRGAAGALLTTAEGAKQFESPVVDTVDTTGAGDVFCGVFAGALAQGVVALDDACGWAVRAAAIAVTRRGTLRAFPSASEVAACRQP